MKKQEKVKKEKVPLSKKAKMWIALGTASVFVASVVAVLLVCLLPKSINLHGLKISNFENYSGIGAASFGKSAENVAYAASDNVAKDKLNLAGITKNNKCEKIEFENEKGKITKQNARLIHFDAYDKFTLFTLTTNKNHEFVEFDDYSRDYIEYSFNYNSFYLTSDPSADYSYKDTSTFILDNETGKIYDMKEVVKGVGELLDYDKPSISLFGLFDSSKMQAGGKKYEPIGQKSILLKASAPDGKGGNEFSIFQASLTDDGLKISQRINAMQFKNVFESQGLGTDSSEVYYNLNTLIQQDIFGNIFIRNYNYPNQFYMCQKNDGTFFDIFGCEMGVNSVMYHGNSYINAQGEFEEIELNSPIVNNDSKVYAKRGNVIFAGNYKITLDEKKPWLFSLETLAITDDGVMQGDFFYRLDTVTGALSKYNMTTHETTVVDSQYEFKNLKYHKNLDRVLFKAVDTTSMLEVDGYFDDNGKIFIGDFNSINFEKSKVYIIKPVN